MASGAQRGSGKFWSWVSISSASLGLILALWSCALAFHWTFADVGGWVSGIGAFAAAAAALIVATDDRRVRERERQDAALAQARLVMITARPTTDDRFRVDVYNYGREPIRDVELADLWLRTPIGNQRYYLGLAGAAQTPRKVVLLPCTQAADEILYREPEFTTNLWNKYGEQWRGDDASLYIKATVKFDDANGQRWVVSNHAEPTREIPIPQMPSPIRGWYRKKKAQRKHKKQLRAQQVPPQWKWAVPRWWLLLILIVAGLLCVKQLWRANGVKSA